MEVITKEGLQKKIDELTKQLDSLKATYEMFFHEVQVNNNNNKAFVSFQVTRQTPLFKNGKREVDEYLLPAVKNILSGKSHGLTADELFDELKRTGYKFRTSQMPRKGFGIALGNAFRKNYLLREYVEGEWLYRLP